MHINSFTPLSYRGRLCIPAPRIWPNITTFSTNYCSDVGLPRPSQRRPGHSHCPSFWTAHPGIPHIWTLRLTGLCPVERPCKGGPQHVTNGVQAQIIPASTPRGVLWIERLCLSKTPMLLGLVAFTYNSSTVI